MKHRRIISLLSAALLGVSVAAFPPAALEPVSIVAEAATYGDWEYTVSGSNATITGYNGTSTTPSIPSSIKGKTVTTIGANAFCPVVNKVLYPKNITEVTIPNTVTTIGLGAFAQTPLKKIVLPASVQTVGNSAFHNCTALKSMETKGALYFGAASFKDCTAMTHVKIHRNCTASSTAFTNCTALYAVNRCSATSTNALTYIPDANGKQMPVLNQDPNVRMVMKNCFMQSTNVKFIDDYCTALCKYIVDTEIKSWMSDAVKARQLHNWLVRHCNYEDNYNQNGVQNESMNDMENHTYYSAFFSYGLDIRGAGIGETVCEGFAKAYTMLLTQANIKSYVLEASGTSTVNGDYLAHAWNLVRIGSQWYQVDVTADDGCASDAGTSAVPGYGGFLKSETDMHNFHLVPYAQNYQKPTVMRLTSNTGVISKSNHPLLLRYYNYTDANTALKACSAASMKDSNGDGLLDNDYDFSGTSNDYDTYYKNQIKPYFNNGYTPSNGGLSALLDYLVLAKLSPSQLLDRAQKGYHIV